MFCPDPTAGDIFEVRGVNRETGCVVVVRPDQYVSHVLPLDEHKALAAFFAGILIDSEESGMGAAGFEPATSRV
jgi:phenol 2-monooxygenase (NADPH)